MNITFGKTHCEVELQHLDFGQVVQEVQYSPSGLVNLPIRVIGREFFQRICKAAGEPSELSFFVKWQQFEVFPSFYDRPLYRRVPYSIINYVNRKIKIFYFFLPLGNSSRRDENWVFDRDTGKPLMTASILSVNVNPRTRRPMPFSEHLRSYFNSENCSEIPGNVKFERLPHSCGNKYKMPDNVITHTSTTRISILLVDRHKHTNQSVYADICYDCLADALSRNLFSLPGSIFDYKIRRMSFLYLKESRLDDLLQTTVWQDASHDWKFKFHVKKDGAVISQVEIEFYPELKPKL